VVVPRATYKLRNSAISNEEMVDVEKIISKTYRRVSSTGPTFPTTLLYMPSKWAGMGYKRLTDIVNNQKMAHLYRQVMKVGPTKNALLAMIDIACRERGKETKPNMIINIEGKEKIKDKLWINSIIEDTARWDVQLTIGGKYEDSDQSWPESRVNDVRPGRHFEIDFMTLHNDEWRRKFNGKYEILTQGKTLSEEYRHQIKYDQAYTNCNGKEVFEVLGTHGDEETPDLEIRIWERMDEGEVKRGSRLKLSEITPSCGMGCNMRMKWEDVFQKSRMQRSRRTTIESNTIHRV
jgi:hypothetical protein